MREISIPNVGKQSIAVAETECRDDEAAATYQVSQLVSLQYSCDAIAHEVAPAHHQSGVL